MGEAFVGLDLAWGVRARTGVAVVDDAGQLVASTAVTTDDEIVAWLEGAADHVVVAAIDAPLVVRNPTGQRACEREVTAVFGRYSAGCHPSNLSRPWFDPPRGAVLAERLGWAVDPGRAGAVGAPVALEVYPHASMVGLFELPRVLPYKAKKGRTPELRRAAFEHLLALMEGIEVLGLRSDARWGEIRAAVDGATRQVHLERVEDEIDSILCAHLAWLWHHERAALHVYGDRADGFIVTTPPPTHAPGPR